MKKIYTLTILCTFIFGLCWSRISWYNRTHPVVSVIREIQTQCAALPKVASLSCLRKGLAPFIHPQSARSLMRILEGDVGAVAQEGEISNPACHTLGHIVGEELGEKYRAQMAKSIGACGRSCGYGCAHGVIVGVLRQDPTMINHIETICTPTKYDRTDTSDSIACYHGVGHAVAEYTSYELVKALGYCQSFDSQEAQEECATGVFMEIYDSPTRSQSLPPVPGDIHGYCAQFSGLELFCARQMGAVVYKRTNDIAEAFALCRSSSEKEISQCAVTLGSAAYFIEEGNAAGISAACRMLDMAAVSCINGALISSLVIDATGIQGRTICKTVIDQTDQCTDFLERQQRIMKEERP